MGFPGDTYPTVLQNLRDMLITHNPMHVSILATNILQTALTANLVKKPCKSRIPLCLARPIALDRLNIQSAKQV
jgi:hypothetical protein